MNTTIVTKHCPKCKTPKSISEFSKNKRRQDGLQFWCKSCQTKVAYTYRQTPNGHQRSQLTNRRSENSAKTKATRRAYQQQHLTYPDRKARLAVTHAIEYGRLQPARTYMCYYCDSQATSYHHIRGYDKAHHVDVIAMCRICHEHIHRAIVLQS